MHETRKFIWPPLLVIMAFVFSYLLKFLRWWASNIIDFWSDITLTTRIDMTKRLPYTAELGMGTSFFYARKYQKIFSKGFSKHLGHFCLKQESLHVQLNSIWPSFCHISSFSQCNDLWKTVRFKISHSKKFRKYKKQRPYPAKGGIYGLSDFMHKTLLKSLLKVKKAVFWTFGEDRPSKSYK